MPGPRTGASPAALNQATGRNLGDHLRRIPRDGWCRRLVSEYAAGRGVHRALVPVRGAFRNQFGVGIAGGKKVDLQGYNILPGLVYPEKALITRLTINGVQITAASYHAPPGSNRDVGVKKAMQAVSFAKAIADTPGPIILGADFNTPKIDAIDFCRVRTWWDTGRCRSLRGLPGEDQLAGPGKIHDLEDALRRWLSLNPAEEAKIRQERPNGPLAVSFRRGTGENARDSRYDAIWITEEFMAVNIAYPYQEVVEKRKLSDHSPVILDLLYLPG
jgi:hypothetical protein